MTKVWESLRRGRAGEGLGRVWEGLGEDRRVVGDVGGWGDFGPLSRG